MLRLGKHRGQRYEEVATADRGYCAWILREKALPQGFSSFYKYLFNVHGGIMHVGKHKGRFFDEVLTEAPDYCEWALTLQAPSDCFQPFIAYSRAHLQKETAPPAKKPRAEEGKYQDGTEKVCAICCDRRRDSVLVPCGHIVACMECGMKFDDQNCPICKQYVSLVVKTYTV
jgi:hypothetical protein